ncbi:hypothetical protein [Bacteroides eggerthii]|uniref:hypothetical protein n=1 Tax=Bacteroides eggerthii TaxID=28111 RepID=UPI0022E0779F|nr:hypothetical protein [Bacteroides eggerthii]
MADCLTVQPDNRQSGWLPGWLVSRLYQCCNVATEGGLIRRPGTEARRERDCPGGFYPLRAKWL